MGSPAASAPEAVASWYVHALRVRLRRDRGSSVGGVELDDNAHGHSWFSSA